MKKRLFVIAAIVLLLAAVPLFPRDDLPGWETPDILTASQSRRIRREILRAAKVCRDAEDMDAMEARLMEAGFAAVDTDAVYPSCLANADGLREFAGADEADTSVIRVNDEGGFSHLFFTKGNEDLLVLTRVSGDFRVSECEILPLYEAEVSDWDVFYYRCYPAGDPHYIDYNLFRLTPVDRELYDLTQTYILPVGYRWVNLFLTDWQEGAWAGLQFQDTFEYLYEIRTGQPFPWQEYPRQPGSDALLIPAQLFEETLLSCFSISREALRTAARYDGETDSYLWRPVHGDDLTTWDYPLVQPEVTAYVHNADGTITLTVQAASAEVKTNCLFTHEVTLRPLENGGFQYVGNRITSIGSWGLPPAMKRLESVP